jgi:predicted transcriptional regulator
MSKTVSFVARDELAEWLEQRAEERMKSISAVCQDIVAEEYRRQQDEKADKPDQSEKKGDVFDRNPNAWYKPNGKYDYAVYIPENADISEAGGTRYYKTRDGAAKALRRWYNG